MDETYGNPDNAPAKKTAYAKKLKGMDEKELFDACEQMIWLSAYAANNPRSKYHWQCDYCYDECKNRNKLEIYSKAHKKASGQ